MADLEIDQKIKSIISTVAGIPISALENGHRLREELMLDSLKEMEIVARTEIAFGISLDESSLIEIRTLGDFRRIVENSLHGK
jgi:acyl carrier protein